VYGVTFTDSTNAPFATTFTLSYNKSSTYSHSSQSGEHSSYSTNVATDTLDATQSSPPSILSSESSSSSGSVPATASATADQTPKNDTTVSSGAAAGIAIACAVFGAILAAAIVGVFLRRRYQHAADRSHRSEPWEKSRGRRAGRCPNSLPWYHKVRLCMRDLLTRFYLLPFRTVLSSANSRNWGLPSRTTHRAFTVHMIRPPRRSLTRQQHPESLPYSNVTHKSVTARSQRCCTIRIPEQQGCGLH
jgi:hypothetical protein